MNFTTSVTNLARLVGEANNVEYLFVLESVQPPIAIRSFRVGLEFLNATNFRKFFNPESRSSHESWAFRVKCVGSSIPNAYITCVQILTSMSSTVYFPDP